MLTLTVYIPRATRGGGPPPCHMVVPGGTRKSAGRVICVQVATLRPLWALTAGAGGPPKPKAPRPSPPRPPPLAPLPAPRAPPGASTACATVDGGCATPPVPGCTVEVHTTVPEASLTSTVTGAVGSSRN